MRNKIKKILCLLLILVISLGGYVYINQKRIEKEIRIENKVKELGWDLNTIHNKINYDNGYNEYIENLVETEKAKIADYLGSDEYRSREFRKSLEAKTGMKLNGYTQVTFQLSFYSDLNCENGYGNLTASGKRLTPGMIANNFLPFGTKVYLEGYGVKTVEDVGSSRYFYDVSKVDVFVPRYYGESVGSYYRRVNNMGRRNVTGYILKPKRGGEYSETFNENKGGNLNEKRNNKEGFMYITDNGASVIDVINWLYRQQYAK